ncbi:MAG: ribonuclease HIII [Verrucomicrobia bacterium]|nr:ribonuclease HIII [Verrucomicrobiota bacterium]
MSPFVTELSPNLKDPLRQGLLERGFEFSQAPHTEFVAKKKGVSCTLYTSGKLVVQGKEMEDFIKFFLEPEILSTFTYGQAPSIDMRPRIGGDEAGKGDFFGPLCVAAVFADEQALPQLVQMGVRDSKAMKDDQIMVLGRKILRLCPYHVLKLHPPKYNELYSKFKNLNSLLAWCHSACIETLHQKTGCQLAIVDQFAKPHVLQHAVRKKGLILSLEQKVHGESDIVVAAASILARAAFVHEMEKLGEEVGMELPKGAAPQVVRAGRKLVAAKGADILNKVGKLHFKTTKEILS